MSDVEEKMSLLESETQFGLNLLQQQPLDSSLVFSPVSIALALSLLHAGAKGTSKSQISNALAKGFTDDKLIEHYSQISQAFGSAKNGVSANIANRVFAKDGFKIEKSYLDAVQKHYKAGATNVNFDDTKKAADTINAFVAQNTANKIENLVTPEIVDGAVAILVNALYFKGDWESKFYSSETTNKTFYSAANSGREVPFLRDTEVHREFAQDEDFEVLSLKYADTSFSFAIFLPKQRFGLQAALKEKLTAARFQTLLKNVKSTYITVEFPKLKIEKTLTLPPILAKLGITDIFTDAADLSALAAPPPALKVSDGVHKALIEVDEEGTTAAAATMFKVVPKMMRLKKPQKFTADHPFLFALLKNNHPIFLGVHA